MTDKGQVLNNLDNVVRAIEADPELRGRIWYDEFLDAIVTTWQGPQRQWKDADDVLLQLYMQRHVGLTKIGVQTCHDAALVAAFHATRNECKDWLAGLRWDGVNRLAHLMSEGFGAAENAYTEAVGRCWVISMVARVMRPARTSSRIRAWRSGLRLPSMCSSSAHEKWMGIGWLLVPTCRLTSWFLSSSASCCRM